MLAATSENISSNTHILFTGKVMYWKALRKHAYLNILKILQPKQENFHMKISDIFISIKKFHKA